MIIKIQLSIVTNAGERVMLIHDKKRKFVYEGPATPEIIEALQPANGKYYFEKAYFNAHLRPDPKSDNPKAKRFEIDSWADPQDW